MDAELGQGGTCLELALEGERLCKSGDFNGGVAFFEAAVKEGTSDLRTLSAIYSQLGNAYFYLGDYNKALNYHQLDLNIAKSMSDRVGEGKASGNLGNTLKMLGRFEEAVECCTTHLVISRELSDKIGEGRAMYNLGNVYHTKGKQMAKSGLRDPGDFPDDVKQCLLQAVHYYEQNLALMVEMGDKCAQGRACGNLGNTHYLLGNFKEAVTYHSDRLAIAKDFGDKAAERRAHCNLGNAHIFLGDFKKAVDNYKETLSLAQELKDRVVEAQACYSLGNTYTLLRDYPLAIEYHARHLAIARELQDKVGENRAYWSLGNAHTATGSHQDAITFAKKHLHLSKEIGDVSGENSAQNSIVDLQKLIDNCPPPEIRPRGATAAAATRSDGGHNFQRPVTPKRNNKKRLSMDNMELLKMTPNLSLDEAASSNFHLNLMSDKDHSSSKETRKQSIPISGPSTSSSNQQIDCDSDERDFFDVLVRFQEERMEDQRATFEPTGENNKENRRPPLANGPTGTKQTRHVRRNPAPLNRSASNGPGYPGISHANSVAGTARPTSDHIEIASHSTLPLGISASSSSSTTASDTNCRDELFDLIAGLQGRRMDEQRAELPQSVQLTNGPGSLPMGGEQPRERCPSYAMGPGNYNNNHPRALQRMATEQEGARHHEQPRQQPRQMSLGAALPDEDFFDMLMRCQSSRLEDQRSELPGNEEDDEVADVGGPCPSTLEIRRPSESTGLADSTISPQAVSTVPDDDFFSFILRMQSGRIDDQRTCLPEDTTRAKLECPIDEPMRRSTSSGSSAVGSRKGSSSSIENRRGSDRSGRSAKGKK